MIRVGFVIENSHVSWLGGINYFRNLISAILNSAERKIEPVVFIGYQFDVSSLKNFPKIEIVRTRLLDRKHLFWFTRKIVKRFFLYDWFLENVLLKNKILILSHSGFLGEGSNVLTLGWIPDFQHKCLPEFFTQQEVRSRDREFREYCKCCSMVLLSSYSAQLDLEKHFSFCKSKSRVLQFVVDPGRVDHFPSLERLMETYQFKGLYFHLPNQFWAHKNHRVVVEALKLLKLSGKKVLVLATGNTKDYRRPEYFQSLMSYVRECGVEDLFKVLGIVPQNDLYALMRNAVALINPSVFEGWSTTVEEAKSLGKRIVLSDIPVHREQVPGGGVYFDPKDPLDLSEAMWKLWSSYSFEEDQKLSLVALQELPKRKEDFVRKYESLIIEALEKSQRGMFS